MLLRSAFWLSVGFAVVSPHGTDFGATVSAVKDQVLAAGLQAGEQLVMSQMLGGPKLSLPTTSSSSPSVALPMQGSPTLSLVFPRPRPAAMG
ncbi:MAG: hypothetical protein ABI697_08005 [Devosia sp.]